MARIFISYSRVDIEITERLVDRLRRIFTHENVWYDDNLHGGDSWWLEIIRQIAACDVFIYLLSNESVTSPYCLAEFEEARRLQKRIITVQVRDRTRIPDELDDIQYVNMAMGITDEALARLAGSINKQSGLARKLRPLWQPATPRPSVPKHEVRTDPNDTVDTPTLNVPTRTVVPQRRSRLTEAVAIIIAAIIGLIGIIIATLIQTNANMPPITPLTTTTVADAATLNNFQAAPSPSPLVSLTSAPTLAPTIDTAATERDQLFASLTALGVQAQDAASAATVDAGNRAATVLAGNAISEATGTAEALIRDAVNTATAVAIAIEQARLAETGTQAALDATGTQIVMDLYTDTPTSTPTYTPTPTPRPAQVFIDAFTVDINTDIMRFEIRREGETPVSNYRLLVNNFTTGILLIERLIEVEDGFTQVVQLSTEDIPGGGIEIVVNALDENGNVVASQSGDFAIVRPTATLTPREAAMIRAHSGVGSNDEWTPYIENIDGVPMALAPAGCFVMGSDEIFDAEPHQQCFIEPFWIDAYEVTNAQFTTFGGEVDLDSYMTNPERPREQINWFAARDFCENKRGNGVRLPTEREWEYAARGVDNLVYPWGDEFEAENVVYADNTDETADVGSRTGGMSWVGALDLSGNVWEWVSTIYGYDEDLFPDFSDSGDFLYAYPYVGDDGREEYSDETAYRRVVRGGSFLNSSLDLRAAYRNVDNPDFGHYYVGFRCARS